MGVGESRELRDALAVLPSRDTDGDGAGSKSKTVYLVRHTRSEQNSGARQYTEGYCCLGSLSNNDHHTHYADDVTYSPPNLLTSPPFAYRRQAYTR